MGETKVYAIEVNGKRMDFTNGIPVGTIKFVTESVDELNKLLEKMKQWYSPEQIAEFCRENLKLEAINSVKNIGKRLQRAKNVNRQEVAIAVFNNFAGQTVQKHLISKFITEKFSVANTTGSAMSGEILEKINGHYCTWNKETNIVNFKSKTKTSGEGIGNLKYDNAATMGVD